MKNLQRVRFISKEGQPHDMVLKIVKKQSKDILVFNPEDESTFSIPRLSVRDITDPEKPTKDEE